MQQCSFLIQTHGRGLTNVTKQVDDYVSASNVAQGVAHVFIHHTSASLIITENTDRDVQSDLNAFFRRLVPDGDPRYRHADEGPDDMSAHIRSVLTMTSLCIPIAKGQLDLGLWQGLYVWEHRTHPHRRRISVSILS